MSDASTEAPAIFSPDRRYRYVLRRQVGFGDGHGRCLFICLNPSIADETTDDPTVRRCIGFARTWGYRELSVVNIFALRSTNPDALRQFTDPIGPENDRHIRIEAEWVDRIVVAWGNHGAYRGRSSEVQVLLRGLRRKCFGLTKAGEPRHPLYLAKDTELQEFPYHV